MVEDNHDIDAFGIGTNLVTCQAQPALGMVYKVVEFQGTPRLKFSEEVGKITLPGPKTVLRIFKEENVPAFDLLCTSGEADEILKNEGELKYYLKKALDSGSATLKPFSIEKKTHVLFENGKRVHHPPALSQRRKTVIDNLQQFGGFEKLIQSEERYQTYLSETVYNLFCTKYKELLINVE